METKHDKWLRLFKSRKLKIREQLRLIINLSNKGNYTYSDEEANQFFDELEEMLRDARKIYFGFTKFTLEEKRD